MKFIITIIMCLVAFQIQAQNNIVESVPPNTETAFLNYDYRLQTSGYEQVEAKMVYSYLEQPLRLYFTVDSMYDYLFVAICDSTTGGLKAECFFEDNTAPFVQSDVKEVIKDFNSKITLLPLDNNERSGSINVLLTLNGNKNAAEPSYYILARRKKVY